MRVKEIMKEAVAINSDMSLKEAAKIMTTKGIGSLIVLKGGEIAGIITEKDITKNAPNLTKRVSSVMFKSIVTVDHEEELDHAAFLMSKNKIKHLPVVKEEKLVGVITATDLIDNVEDLDDDFFFD